jgi:hypothetical protein
MNNPVRHSRKITRVLHLVFILIVLVLPLIACSSRSDQDKIVVSGDQLTAPLPVGLVQIDQNNLIVKVVIFADGVPQEPSLACDNLSVNQSNGTFSCNVLLPAGSYSLGIKFSVNDETYGVVRVVSAPPVDVEVVAGETREADFSSVTYAYDDDDGDGVDNLDELYAGTNPNDSACILDNSLIDKCTLG